MNPAFAKNRGLLVPRVKATEKCQSCGLCDAAPLHVCPYQQDVYDNYEFTCNCCHKCAHQCAMDI